jgi:5-methylcytosine-specific restriction endonuclease McrA
MVVSAKLLKMEIGKHMLEDEWVDEGIIAREKAKARKMRHTAWWARKIQGGICYYCGSSVGSGNLTMDHVVPLSRGGRSKKGNLVPACKECNNKKSYLLPIEWEEYLRNLNDEKTLI